MLVSSPSVSFTCLHHGGAWRKCPSPNQNLGWADGTLGSLVTPRGPWSSGGRYGFNLQSTASLNCKVPNSTKKKKKLPPIKIPDLTHTEDVMNGPLLQFPSSMGSSLGALSSHLSAHTGLCCLMGLEGTFVLGEKGTRYSLQTISVGAVLWYLERQMEGSQCPEALSRLNSYLVPTHMLYMQRYTKKGPEFEFQHPWWVVDDPL